MAVMLESYHIPQVQQSGRPSSSLSGVPTTPTKRKPMGLSHISLSSKRKKPLFFPDDSDDDVSDMTQGTRTDTPPSSKMTPTTHDVGDSSTPPHASEGPKSLIVECVLEVVPDVNLDHLNTLIDKCTTTYNITRAVEGIVHVLLDDQTYPKAESAKAIGKCKGANVEGNAQAGSSKNPKVDYESVSRQKTIGIHYTHISLLQLQKDFPYVPRGHILQVFASKNRFYAPTYTVLAEQERQFEHQKQAPGTKEKKSTLPYTRRANPYRPQKWNCGARAEKIDSEFEQERAWVLEQVAKKDLEFAETINEDEYEYTGGGIECGCCFSTHPFEKLIQCPEAHLFCKTCMESYASNLLWSHDTDVKCLHQSGCTLPIPASELSRFLSEKQMSLWERLKQRREVEKAGLDGWEECPFCDWGCVMEVSILGQRLFRCENEDVCGVVSCRTCKKLDHLPKTCKEVERNEVLEGRHFIEEAMSRALVRNCPKCQKPFVKGHGCNMMTCSCGARSCYACRELLLGSEVSTHFQQKKSCIAASHAPEQLHTQDVKAAAARALQEYSQDHPEVNEDEIKVDVL